MNSALAHTFNPRREANLSVRTCCSESLPIQASDTDVTANLRRAFVHTHLKPFTANGWRAGEPAIKENVPDRGLFTEAFVPDVRNDLRKLVNVAYVLTEGHQHLGLGMSFVDTISMDFR